jgi:hypothetical protein
LRCRPEIQETIQHLQLLCSHSSVVHDLFNSKDSYQETTKLMWTDQELFLSIHPADPIWLRLEKKIMHLNTIIIIRGFLINRKTPKL